MLDAELFRVVERRDAGSLCGVLKRCSIVDRIMRVRGVPRFLGGGMVKLGAEIGDVVVHCEAAGALIIVPLDIYSSIEVAFFIDCYIIFFLRALSK